MVLPALIHSLKVGRYRSELGAFFTSKVKTVPSGIKVQPSSAFQSLLPGATPCFHVMVFGSSIAMFISSLSPIMNWPFGNTVDGESPINCQPGGGCSVVQEFVSGS